MVDSVDAVASFVGLSVEDVCVKIIDVVRGAEIRTLIITERMERTALDYICDGVVTFRKKFVDGRLFRELVIEKLRGVEIRNPIYYFTLHEGKFKYFDKFSPLERGKRLCEPHPVIKDGKGTEFYKKGMFSTGSQQLDGLLGGLRRGSFVLVEVLEEISSEFAIDITSSVMENFMMQGRGVITVPCKSISPSYLINIYSGLVGEEKVKKFCKIIIPSRSSGGEPFSWLILTDYSMDSFLETFNKVIDSFKKELDENVLLHLSFDRLETNFGSENAEKIAMEIVSKAKLEGDLCIGITFPSTEISPKLRQMADTFLRFFSKEDTVFIYGVHPPTRIYNVNIDFSQPHPKLYFTPVT